MNEPRVTNTDLRRLSQLCYEQARTGGLPTDGGGSEFGCLMAVIQELLELRQDFGCYANHTADCAVKSGGPCSCGCADKRSRNQRSVI